MITRQRIGELDQLDIQILRSYSEGAPSEAVATDLAMPMRTLERRLSSIRSRLDAPNTIAAVVTAIRRGYL